MTSAVNAGLREARVQENEQRILRAAQELFVRNGYRRTSLTAVAEAAGVAHRTVYVRFGTKAALLKRVVDVAIVGDLAPVAVTGRDWYRAATSAATLGERIDEFARGSAQLLASAADVIAVAAEAEAAEPLLADAARAGRAATREAVRGFWASAEADGLLPAGCDVGWLVETSSALAQAQSYLLMRETSAMTPGRYEEWLGVTYRRLVSGSART